MTHPASDEGSDMEQESADASDGRLRIPEEGTLHVSLTTIASEIKNFDPALFKDRVCKPLLALAATEWNERAFLGRFEAIFAAATAGLDDGTRFGFYLRQPQVLNVIIPDPERAHRLYLALHCMGSPTTSQRLRDFFSRG